MTDESRVKSTPPHGGDIISSSTLSSTFLYLHYDYDMMLYELNERRKGKVEF